MTAVSELVIIEAFITLGIPTIVGAVFAAVKHFIGVQRLAKLESILGTKSVLAQDAVKFAEDAFIELDGIEKLENTKKNLISRLNQYGVAVTEDEADTLVRVAFQTLKTGIVTQVKRKTDVPATA